MAKHSTGIIPNETVKFISEKGSVTLTSQMVYPKLVLTAPSGTGYLPNSEQEAIDFLEEHGMEQEIPDVKHRAMSSAKHLATHGEFTEQFCYGDFHFVKIDSAVGFDESYFIDGMGSEYDRLVRLSDVAEEFEYGLEEYHPSEGRRRVAPWGTEGK